MNNVSRESSETKCKSGLLNVIHKNKKEIKQKLDIEKLHQFLTIKWAT